MLKRTKKRPRKANKNNAKADPVEAVTEDEASEDEHKSKAFKLSESNDDEDFTAQSDVS